MGALGAMDVEGLINLDRDLIDCGGECGLRPILMMLGTLDGYQVDSKVLSYEGPFGVGYGVAWFHPGEYSSEKEKVQRFYENRKKANEQARKQEDAYVSLARTSLEEYVRTGKVMRIPENLPPEMLQNRAGIFVSIKKHGQLRGCIGTISPTCRNIAEEIIQNAISAGTKDYRFSPVEEWELEDLRYSVDVLKEPEDISSMEELDTVKYGVIVRKGSRSGLLLPNLAGVDTVEEQVAIALQKAGIRPDEKYKMQRFEVIRHT